jgi:hypothetical protein
MEHSIVKITCQQRMEHKQLYPVLLKHKIIGYFRYISDISVIYNRKQTNICKTIKEFHKQRTNTKFVIEIEHHNSINFLYLTVHQKNTKLESEIYSKAMQTDIKLRDPYHPNDIKYLPLIIR